MRASLRLRTGDVAVWGLVLACLLAGSPAWGLIEGGEGNDPVSARGWPTGVAPIFNHESRIAYWVGPPFGGGQWHGEYRGDAAVLNVLLSQFGQLKIERKRVVVHDGVGQSFWLNINNEPAKREKARMDWRFMVWEPDNWHHLKGLPPDLRPDLGGSSPPSQFDIYTGGNVRWKDVIVPEGIEVIDNRLEAHGFSPEDGNVLTGTVTDLVTGQPLQATVLVESRAPKSGGGYAYTEVARATTDDQGRWVIKQAPKGKHRIVVKAPQYATRIAGHGRVDENPRLHKYSTGLNTAARVSGQVVDAEGKPLVGVEVRLGNLTSENQKYDVSDSDRATTNEQGEFEFLEVPVGEGTLHVYKEGYIRPGLGQAVSIPDLDVRLQMIRSASLRVTVDFSGTSKPARYIVQIEPEGGSAVGKYGGSGTIDARNEQHFKHIPPGRYVVSGRPNPGSKSETTKPVTVDLRGGEDAEITLRAQ